MNPDTAGCVTNRYKHVQPGELAVNISLAWNGSMGVSPFTGVISPAFVFIDSERTLSLGTFITSLRSPSYKIESKQYLLVWFESRLRLYTDDLYRLEGCSLLSPNKPPSSVISTTVDRRIRRYIRAKQKLIALLEEQKQVLIHQAVTGRIDVRTRRPYPAYKDSGVEWLGDVPAHWEVWRVGLFSRVGNGSTPSRGNPAYWSDGAHPWLNSSSVNQGIITRADQFVTDLALCECHLPRVRPGSVLVGITGQGKTRGMSAVLAIEATINQHMAYITPTTAQVSSHYLHMCLTTAYSELRAISGASGSTKGALTCEDIKRFKLYCHP